MNSYDQVPYPSYPYSNTRPEHLATIATLLGLESPLAPYRVLELGCASGGNLIPMAMANPECSYVGIDASERQVALGRENVERLQLKNITLDHRSIVDIDDKFGMFDFIICHGVYSWVPGEVQEKILKVCSANLTKNGIAFVSYNTEPGWRQRGALRDMMRYHAERDPHASSQQKIEQARDLLEFLVQATKDSNNAYGAMLREHYELLQKHSDAYVFHEHLEEHNEPLWFLDLCNRLESHALQFLGEADFGSMVVSMSWPPELQSRLDKMTHNLYEQEQYTDFVRNRAFRQSLICHAARAPSYAIAGERLHPLYAASRVKIASNPAKGTKEARFELPNGESFSTTSQATQYFFNRLSCAWPNRIAIDSLLTETAQHCSASEDEQQLTRKKLESSLINIYSSSSGRLLELSVHPLECISCDSERPIANAIARYSATRDEPIVNRRHDVVHLDPIDLRILQLLDGTRGETQILEELIRQYQVNDLEIRTQDDVLITDQSTILAILKTLLPQRIEYYKQSSLLD